MIDPLSTYPDASVVESFLAYVCQRLNRPEPVLRTREADLAVALSTDQDILADLLADTSLPPDCRLVAVDIMAFVVEALLERTYSDKGLALKSRPGAS